MFDQVKSIYIRCLTIAVFIALPLMIWDNVTNSINTISDSMTEIENVELLETKLNSFLAKTIQPVSPKLSASDSTFYNMLKELKQPVDFITLNGEAVKKTGGKIIQVETKESVLNSEKISIRFNADFLSTYPQWIEYRKTLDKLPCKIIYHQSASEKTFGGLIQFKEELEFVKYL